jgi:hypothetical protein
LHPDLRGQSASAPGWLKKLFLTDCAVVGQFQSLLAQLDYTSGPLDVGKLILVHLKKQTDHIRTILRSDGTTPMSAASIT